MNLSLMLDGQGGNVGVSYEAGTNASGVKDFPKARQVIGAGVDWRYVGVLKPFP